MKLKFDVLRSEILAAPRRQFITDNLLGVLIYAIPLVFINMMVSRHFGQKLDPINVTFEILFAILISINGVIRFLLFVCSTISNRYNIFSNSINSNDISSYSRIYSSNIPEFALVVILYSFKFPIIASIVLSLLILEISNTLTMKKLFRKSR